MYHRRKQVGIYFTVNVTDFFNDFTQTLIFSFQIFYFALAIAEIQSIHLLPP